MTINKKQNKRVASMAFLGAAVADNNNAKTPKSTETLKHVKMPADLKSLTVKKLVTLHNKLAEQLGVNSVKHFANKPSAIKKITKLSDALGDSILKVSGIECKKPTKLTKPAKQEEQTKTSKRHTFGSKISAKDVTEMITSTFGENTFVVRNVVFENEHYWYCNLMHVDSGLQAKRIRVDYLVNYLRVPRAFKTVRSEILSNLDIEGVA